MSKRCLNSNADITALSEQIGEKEHITKGLIAMWQDKNNKDYDTYPTIDELKKFRGEQRHIPADYARSARKNTYDIKNSDTRFTHTNAHVAKDYTCRYGGNLKILMTNGTNIEDTIKRIKKNTLNEFEQLRQLEKDQNGYIDEQVRQGLLFKDITQKDREKAVGILKKDNPTKEDMHEYEFVTMYKQVWRAVVNSNPTIMLELIEKSAGRVLTDGTSSYLSPARALYEIISNFSYKEYNEQFEKDIQGALDNKEGQS